MPFWPSPTEETMPTKCGARYVVIDLGGIGDAATLPELQPFPEDEGPERASAARAAIRAIGVTTI